MFKEKINAKCDLSTALKQQASDRNTSCTFRLAVIHLIVINSSEERDDNFGLLSQLPNVSDVCGSTVEFEYSAGNNQTGFY